MGFHHIPTPFKYGTFLVYNLTFGVENKEMVLNHKT